MEKHIRNLMQMSFLKETEQGKHDVTIISGEI